MHVYAISLCDALSKGHYKKALAYLDSGLPANGDFVYRPLLSISHQNPKRALDLARALVAAGADVNASNDKGWRVLHHAIWLHDASTEYLAFLLDQGADPYLQSAFAPNTAESDALSACVRYKRPEAFKLLLERNVKPVQPANKDLSALGRAMRICSTEKEVATYVIPLLEAGADPNEVDPFGRPLSWAATPVAVSSLNAWVKCRQMEASLPVPPASPPKSRM